MNRRDRYNSNYKSKVNGVGVMIVETGDVFETREACARYLGVSPGMITMCLNGSVHTCRGYHIEMVDMEFGHHLNDDILNELYDLTGVDCEWKEHPDRPDIYVSDTGIIAKNVRGRIVIKEPHVINSGYLAVSVDDYRTRRSKNSNYLVHRLVAETYIPNHFEKKYVNHIDGDKFNNCVDNLEWVTRSENMRHAYDHGLYPTERIRIVETGEVFKSASECARAIGGTSCGICDCKKGRQTSHRGYHFEFLSDVEYSDFYGIMVMDIYTDETGYFSSIPEAEEITGISRSGILDVLSEKIESLDRFTFWYADREECMLYAREDVKLLSWIRLNLR